MKRQFVLIFFIVILLFSCTPQYRVNETVRGRIKTDSKYYEFSECFTSIDLSKTKYSKYELEDSIALYLRDKLNDKRGVRYIKIDTLDVVYGTSQQLTTIYTIYSPNRLGQSFYTNNYFLGICKDLNDLDSTQKDIFKREYQKYFLDSIKELCN